VPHMNGLISAIEFLTTIPIRSKNFSLQKSIVFFPIVGMIIGSILVGANILLKLVFPKMICDAITVVILILLTGALHLDGFADTIDGFFGGRNKNEILKIMSDEHIGAFAVVGIFCLLLLKFIFIFQMPDNILYPALILMPILGKFSMVISLVKGNPAKNNGLGSIFLGNAGLLTLIVSGIVTLSCCAFFLNARGVYLFIIISLIALSFKEYFTAKIDGLTGDTMGAIHEITELCVLVTIFLLTK